MPIDDGVTDAQAAQAIDDGVTEPPIAPAVDDVRWGQLGFRVTSYRSDRPPGGAPVTSARAIVRRADQVLVVCDPTSMHVLPGGRLEPGEEPEQALRREVLEETGWHVGTPTLLGYLHFRHRGPRPTTGWQPPYPEFCQAVYQARATTYDPSAKEPDGYELWAEFKPIAEAEALPLTNGQHYFLRLALAQRG
ncbi:MAG TPA: NUDIX domain-containing protein [Actinomycetes bacterium]|nr:NUDIX domain-containing protein [Actinomycetes bacterium]